MNDKEQKIKGAILLAGAKAETQYLEAQQYISKIPEDPHAVLDGWQEEVSKWIDHPDLPQKSKVLSLIKRARYALNTDDEGELKLNLFLILKNADNYNSDLWTLKKESADQQNSISAKLPRPKARSTMKANIIALMRSYKSNGTEFEIFMQAWRAEPLGGLRLTSVNKNSQSDKQRFLVDDENQTEEPPKDISRNTLQRNYWAKAF